MSRQIAVVTGAAGAFGRAIVKSLLEVGYIVVATDIKQDALDALKLAHNNAENLHPIVMDVTDADAVKAVAAYIEVHIGSTITVLINNAGIIIRGFCLEENNRDQARQTMDVNLQGTFNCTTVFSHYMARLRYGKIINIASAAGLVGAGGGAAYAASKAGMIGATKSWARELGPLNISVVAVAPGVCETEMMSKITGGNSLKSMVKTIVPIGRWGTAEDVSEVVLFLATCKTNYLNAGVITVDGGMGTGAF